ncbi:MULTISPECIES: SDR family oxidoreductase [unclassified Pseudoalteromonas]|uniref:SDR family NAD(P)-dependent oxidoreductase n=1 Tax=unclassified Pseudoalteromonas TaxID=194690 RepID=UPI002097B751|nr:SDR family oxidoreductase [Pseudoalteromonas sp. XMcav2-N]MCO7188412.1 SDR family oxidoreductase [Pseudoalteromonas sp. XMcav2-N]
MLFKGKKAIVFGGTSGIGLSTVVKLVQEGAEVIAVGLTEGKAVPELPEQVIRDWCDVRKSEQVASIFERYGQLDMIISTATGGTRALGPFLEMDMTGYRNSFDKLWGYANVVRYGAKWLSKNGSIVLLSGSPARRCGQGQIALSSVGAAVEAFVKGVAKEVAPNRINALCPGVIDTPIVKLSKSEKEAYYAARTKHHLIPRVGTADECVQGIVFLLSNEFVTGTVLDVDGGAILAT